MVKNKTALITGSTSGIGAGIAEKLAQMGAHIILNGLTTNEDELKNFIKRLESYGNKVTFVDADLTKPDECDNLIIEAKKLTGQIDILVNNAGAQYVAPIEEFPIAKWDFILNLNLSAPFRLIKAVLPLMKKQDFGRIINIASAHGLVASAGKSAYVSAKHGLVGLTKVIALETATDNITVNAICPGWVLTPLVQEQIDKIASKDNISNEEASIKLLSEKQPSLDFVKPENIGAYVAFLSSNDGAQITGTTHSIDGGWTAR